MYETWSAGMRRYALACLFLTFFVVECGSSADAQDKADALIGRYELHPGVLPGDHAHLMIDTTTGECWTQKMTEGANKHSWVNIGFPVKDTKVSKGDCGRFRLRTQTYTYQMGGTIVRTIIVWDTVDGRCWQTSPIGLRGKDLVVKWGAVPSPDSK